MSRVDRMIRAAATVTVVGLAGVAGAISYSHMAHLAHEHGETGWRAHMFPLSVDGIEIVSSLVLLADKRAGRASGWLPWAALVAGAAASFAANIAVGGSDWIGRAVSGWPAVAFLVAVKLLFGLLEHPSDDTQAAMQPAVSTGRPAAAVQQSGPAMDGPDAQSSQGGDGDGTVRDDQRTSGATAWSAMTTPENPAQSRLLGGAPPPTEIGSSKDGPDGDSMDERSAPGSRGLSPDLHDVAHLIPAAREARTALADAGRSLSRDSLADAMRTAGHGVSNARTSLLVRILKAEQVVPTIGSEPSRSDGRLNGRTTA